MPRDFHTPVSFGLRFVAIGLLSLFAMLTAMPAGAQDSPPPARDYVSCGHFNSQESAQELLDSGDLDELGEQSLDGDGDGIACENAFDTGEAEAAPADVARLPNTGTGAGDASSSNGVMLASLILASGSLLLLSRKLAIR